MDKKQQWNIWYFIGAFFLLMIFQGLWTQWRRVESIPYSDFLKYLNEGRIVEAVVHQEQITGRLKEPINGRDFFITNRVFSCSRSMSSSMQMMFVLYSAN